MSRYFVTTAVMLSLTTPVFAAGSHSGGHHDEMAIGQPGDAGQVDRVVEVSLSETDDGRMIFEPGELTFQEGETVRLAITNTGELDHEFVLGTNEENMEHKALMEKFPEMEHDDPNAVRLQPGESGEIVWTFSNEGSFEFACLIPGHYESGMHGPLLVQSGMNDPVLVKSGAPDPVVAN